MSRVPAMTPGEVLHAMERAGFRVHHVSGKHYILKHADKPHLRVTLPWHGRELKRGTLVLIDQADYSSDEFLDLL